MDEGRLAKPDDGAAAVGGTTGPAAAVAGRAVDPSWAALERWALIAVYAACLAVFLGNAGRYLPPPRERYIDTMAPGAADLIPTLNAAHALLNGENPYHFQKFVVDDPYAKSRWSDQAFTYLYPPTHAWLYVPIAWVSGPDLYMSMRLQFWISLICVVAIVWAILGLLQRFLPLPAAVRAALFPALCLVLALNPGNMLGIERGQSDLMSSAFAWCAVIAFQQRRHASSAFLVVAATLLKGYGVLLGAGLLLLGLQENWRRTLLGFCSAAAVLLGPVITFLPDGLRAYRIRSAMFWTGWTNQGFANLAYSLGLPRERGRIVLVAFALFVSVAAWLQLKRALAEAPDDLRRRALALSLFASAALITVLGYSLNSISYNCVIAMPGALLLALGQPHWLPERSALARNALGVALALITAGMFVFDLGNAFGSNARALHVPLNAAGQLGLIVLVGTVAVQQLRAASRGYRIAALSAGVIVAVAAAAFVVRTFRPAPEPDLAEGRSWIASSVAIACQPQIRNCGGQSTGVFFHTQTEQQPWFRIDLGQNYVVGVVEVQNRQDCCQERAVPLIVELSGDGNVWTAVARCDELFNTWRATFTPHNTRYVRLRVDGTSTLHLEKVSVRRK